MSFTLQTTGELVTYMAQYNKQLYGNETQFEDISLLAKKLRIRAKVLIVS